MISRLSIQISKQRQKILLTELDLMALKVLYLYLVASDKEDEQPCIHYLIDIDM